MTNAEITNELAQIYLGYAQPLNASQRALERAWTAGQDWSWTAAEVALDLAYEAMGGCNEGSGYDWHCGRHPIQVAARDL